MKVIRSQPVRKFGGWIAEDGKYYPCDEWMHDAIGIMLARQYYGKRADISTLEEKGWMRLYNTGCIALDRHNKIERKITQKQLDTLADLLQAGKDDAGWVEYIDMVIRHAEVVS